MGQEATLALLGIVSALVSYAVWQNRQQLGEIKGLRKAEAVCREKLSQVLLEQVEVKSELSLYRRQQDELHGQNTAKLDQNSTDLSAIKEKIVNGGGGPDLKTIDRHVKAQAEQLKAVVDALARMGFDKDGNPLPKSQP